MFTITADVENFAELFWSNLDEQMPELADKLRRGSVAVDSKTWEAVQAMEGFADGPAYAPTALICL